MLRKIRIVTATIVFIAVTLLFLDFTGTVQAWAGWTAKMQLLPAILAGNFVIVAVLLVVTLVMGRIYCSVICPLGVLQDIVAAAHNRVKQGRYTYSKAVSWLRYLMLALMIVALVGGLGALVALLAPYSSYGRMVSNLIQPLYILLNNGLAAVASRVDSYAFYHTDIWMRGLTTLLVAVGTLVVIFTLAWRNGRTYCNTICPVGTFLSFFARFSWFKIYFDESKCRHCSQCTRHCKASCIDFKHGKVDYSRCVVCGDCLEHCRFDALHYGHPAKKLVATAPAKATNVSHKHAPAQQASAHDDGRRHFLLATVLAASAAAKAQENKEVEGGLADIEDKIAPRRTTPLTPPGSFSADNMAHHCTACQLCVSECPNEVLRPSSSLDTFMQPVMSYERGYCRPECTRCSEVCPTGAIHLVHKEDKAAIHVGHAVWLKQNCIVLSDQVECGNCARHCPTGAITMVPYQTKDGEMRVPAVDSERCIGCGACENLCPARPFSAIYVEGHEVHKVN